MPGVPVHVISDIYTPVDRQLRRRVGKPGAYPDVSMHKQPMIGSQIIIRRYVQVAVDRQLGSRLVMTEAQVPAGFKQIVIRQVETGINQVDKLFLCGSVTGPEIVL